MQTLVLWDIDQTLIDARGIGSRLCAEAFRTVTRRPLEHLPDMAGRTDRSIMIDALTQHGIAPTEVLLLAFAAAWLHEYRQHVEDLRRDARVLPGVVEVLGALQSNRDVVQSVLTGNMKPTAQLKLDTLGLSRYVDLDVGAFGLDATERPALVDIARKRAADVFDVTFDPASTVLIGDTPNDVHAGRIGRARVVAVATGRSGADVLREAGADVVLPDLRDTAAVLGAILPDRA